MTANAIFQQALDRYQTYLDAGTAETEEAQAVWKTLVDNAPPEFVKLTMDMAEERGLIPPPVGYTKDGERLYDVDSLRHLISEEDLASVTPVDPSLRDPKVEVLRQPDPKREFFGNKRGHFKETGEVDEDGEPVQYVSPEVATVFTLERIHEALTGAQVHPDGEALNAQVAKRLQARWPELKAIARQRGISSIHIDRLDAALRKTPWTLTPVLAAMNRWTAKYPLDQFVQTALSR